MMTSTEELNAHAQAFADELAAANTMYHAPDLEALGEGENIFWASGHSTPDYVLATQKWYDEFIDPGYDWDLPDTMANWQSGAGHFTQVVWNSSTELGMGHAFSASGALFIVARYKSKGNYIGQFASNVFQLTGATAESCAATATDDSTTDVSTTEAPTTPEPEGVVWEETTNDLPDGLVFASSSLNRSGPPEKLIGGQEPINKDNWKFMVHIGKQNMVHTHQDGKIVQGFCHGTIVGDRWILTDGDCCHNFNTGEPSPENTSEGLEIKLENYQFFSTERK